MSAFRGSWLVWHWKRIWPWCNPLRWYWYGHMHFTEWCKFWRNYDQYIQMCGDNDPLPRLDCMLPCLGDDKGFTPVEPIYFYQNAWAFGHIVQDRPAEHIDVGSHHGFVSLLSRVVPVTMVDIRPLNVTLDSLAFKAGSILSLPFADESIASLSSLCVVEHIGLGRYGDSIDPCGTEKAIAELLRVLAPDGLLYISLPLDNVNRVYFNAHRAFDEKYLLSLFSPLEIMDSKYVFGSRFSSERLEGFGVGCYKLRKSRQF